MMLDISYKSNITVPIIKVINFVSATQNGKLPPLPRCSENNGNVSLFYFVLIRRMIIIIGKIQIDFSTALIDLFLNERLLVWSFGRIQASMID